MRLRKEEERYALKLINGKFTIDYGMISVAGILGSLIPVLITVIFQKYIVMGMTAGGVKEEDRIASCRGYANLFKHMCNAVGIDCRLDFGTIEDDPQGHVWDYVKVDGSWYYCDSVWNDGGTDEYPYMFAVDLWESRCRKYQTWGFSESDVQ